MNRLYASVIYLRSLQDGTLTRDAGQWANAAFYNLLHAVDPGLAAGLHQWNGRKPFTISALCGLNAGPGGTNVRNGQECWLRLTALDGEIFEPVMLGLANGAIRPRLKIGPMDFAICEALTSNGSHPWAGFVDAGKLVEQADAVQKVGLEFASPTGFNVNLIHGAGPHYELTPRPDLVFGNLARVWNAFIASEIDVAALDAAVLKTQISYSKLQTRTLAWRGHVQKGFTGKCVYDLSMLDDRERRMFDVLGNFAFYAGMGGKTTQGMGQCRRLLVSGKKEGDERSG